MAIYSYNDFRKVLRKLGFQRIRSKKHEIWYRHTDTDDFKVVVSHKRGEDMPRWLFHKMLKQAGIKSEEEFVRILRGKR